MNVQGKKSKDTIPTWWMKRGDLLDGTYSKSIIMEYCKELHVNKFNNLDWMKNLLKETNY